MDSNLPLNWNATENVAWRTALAGESWSSPIVWGDRVFVTTEKDTGESCRVLGLDRRSGEILWNKEVFRQVPRHKQERIGGGGDFSASPVAAAGRIYFVSDSGETTVFESGAGFQVPARNPLGEKVQASPTISQGQIFIRTDKSLFCIGKN